MAPNEPLSYDVVFSDPIPQNVTGLLPNGERHMFSPLATTLIWQPAMKHLHRRI
jgi:hypothetical protein